MASFFCSIIDWGADQIKALTFPRREDSFVPRARESEPGLAGMGNLNWSVEYKCFNF